MRYPIYTIGHSNLGISAFLAHLRRHDVTAVADVRSQPFSRHHPQFNRDALRASLKQAGIAYVFLGRELGARSENEDCYVDGVVQYDRLAQTALFQQGLERLLKGSRDHRIAMMCAERDPLTCHRTILVARQLSFRGAEILHIAENGAVETHQDATARLLAELGMQSSDLFRPASDIEAEAFQRRAAQIAYVQPDPTHAAASEAN